MATNKKAKHRNVTAVTSNTEQLLAGPERLPISKTNNQHQHSAPIPPDRSNRDTSVGKHPRDITEADQEKSKAKPIIHNTWTAWKTNPIFPIRVIITHIKLGGERNEKNHRGCY